MQVKFYKQFRYILPIISTVFGIVFLPTFDILHGYTLLPEAVSIFVGYLVLLYVSPFLSLMDPLTQKYPAIDLFFSSEDQIRFFLGILVFNALIFYVIGFGIDALIKFKHSKV